MTHNWKYKWMTMTNSPRRHPYFDVVVGLARSYDPESYAGGSLLLVSHARQVKSDDPD